MSDTRTQDDYTIRNAEWYRKRGKKVPMYFMDPEDAAMHMLPFEDEEDLAAQADEAREAHKQRHTGSQRFHEILRSVGDMHDKKQRDYGSESDPFANVRASDDFGIPGWVGAMVRANDKMRRIQKAAQQVTAGEKVSMANEGVEDSFLDLAVYAIIALVLFEDDQS